MSRRKRTRKTTQRTPAERRASGRSSRKRQLIVLGMLIAAAVFCVRLVPRGRVTEPDVSASTPRDSRADASLEVTEETGRIEPDSAEAEYDRGLVLFRQGKLVQAKDCFLLALRKKPDYLDAQTNLGSVFLQEGKLAEAQAHYQRALQIQPDSLEALYNLGNVYLKQGDQANAAAHYVRALRIRPDFTQAIRNLLALLQRCKNPDELGIDYEQLFPAEPHFAAVHNRLGSVLFARGMLDRAKGCYERALRSEPHNVDTHFNLSMLLAAQGEVQQARSYFERAMHGTPQDIQAECWRLATSDDPAVRDPQAVLQWARHAAEHTKTTDVAFLKIVAAAYAAAGRFEDAEQLTARAIRSASRDDRQKLLERHAVYKAAQAHQLGQGDRLRRESVSAGRELFLHMRPVDVEFKEYEAPMRTVVLPEAEPDSVELVARRAARPDYVGAEVCGECHRERYENFRLTGHFLSSQRASDHTVLGPFDSGSNRLNTRVDGFYYQMQKREEGLYQAVFVDGKQWHREKFDIIMGSGKIAQTYLYWQNDALLELPVTYFSATNSWINSPGFPDGAAVFARPAVSRCLECHATYFAPQTDAIDNYRYDTQHYLLGVGCERCHGAGAKHVNYHREHPAAEDGSYIVHPAKLARDRLNDVCAQCHAGRGQPLQPSFTFQPGSEIANYVQLESHPPDADPGIHTNNQLQRLEMSRCFQEDATLSCASCHDPHQKESGDIRLFSQRCQTCHQAESCGRHAELGPAIQTFCVECHMPERKVFDTKFTTQEGVVTFVMRDHFVRAAVDEETLERTIQTMRDTTQPKGSPKVFP